jgi:hypothetical protein
VSEKGFAERRYNRLFLQALRGTGFPSEQVSFSGRPWLWPVFTRIPNLPRVRRLDREAFDGCIGVVAYLGCPAAVVPLIRELAQHPAVRGQRAGAIAAVLLQLREDEEKVE